MSALQPFPWRALPPARPITPSKAKAWASAEFAYSLWMGEPDPALEMEVSVAGERYILHDGQDEMYYYDVYAGAMDMLSAAFGAADAQ